MNKTLHAILFILDKHPTVVGSRRFPAVEASRRDITNDCPVLSEMLTRKAIRKYSQEGRKITPGRKSLSTRSFRQIGFVQQD